MKRTAYVVCCLVLSFVGLGGCSSERSAKQTTAGPTLDRIQGKAQILLTETNATDAALSAGGSSVYLWQGERRYRLFLRTPVELEGGKEYVAEGVYAQKVIDEIGDPDQGKNGYPLQSSCRRAVKIAWPGLSLDTTGALTSVLQARVRRYPARPVFLVTRISPAEESKGSDAAAPKTVAQTDDKDIPEIDVAPEKQKALLVAGSVAQTAPLWEAAGGTVRCKVLIDEKGEITELLTGAQLCEYMNWSQLRYQPTVQRGHPVRVRTDVELRFDPRK